MFDLFRSHEGTDGLGHMALGWTISDSTFRCTLKLAAATGTRHVHHSGGVPALDKQPFCARLIHWLFLEKQHVLARFALQIVSLSCRNYRGGGQLRMTCVDGHLWRRLRRTHTSNWLCNSQASDFKISFDSVHFHTNWVKIRKPLIIEQHEKSKADDIWIWFSNFTILWVIMHRNHFTTTVQNNNGTVRYRDVSQEKSKSWTPNGRWVAPGYPGTQGAQGAGKDLIWVCLNISLWQFMLNSPMVTVTDVNGSKHG